MSAFLVSDKHITEILRFASGKGNIYYNGETLDLTTPDGIQKVGQILVNENYRSLNARYGSVNLSHVFQYEPFSMRPIMAAVEVIKLCHCYDYQACETDDYYETPTHSIVDAIKECAIRALPGYDDAEWSI